MSFAFLREIVDLGPLGYVLLSTPPLVAALSVAAIALRGARGAVLAWAAGAVYFMDLLSSWALVYGSRLRFLRAFDPRDPQGEPWLPTMRLFAALVAERAAAWTALVLLPLVAAALAVGSLPREEDEGAPSTRWAWAIGIALPFWFVAAAAARTTTALFSAGYDCDARCRQEMVEEAYGLLADDRSVVIVVGVVCACLVVGATFASKQAPSRATRGLRITVGVLGCLAFAATRAEAFDAAHPVPFDERATWTEGPGDRLPAAPPSCSPLDGPTLVVDDAGTRVDGTRTTDVAAALTAKRELWKAIHSGAPPSGVLAVAADRSTRMVAVAGILSEAERAGFARPFAVVALPGQTRESATLGTIEMHRRVCMTAIAPGSDGVWADHVGEPRR